MSSTANGQSATAESLLQLLKSVRGNDPNIQQVHIRGKRLPLPYLVALLRAVASSKYVTRLRLTKVGADDSIAKVLAHCIRTSLTLIDVDFSKNSLSDSTCIALARALKRVGKTSMIRRLNLESNLIGDLGMAKLCAGVAASEISILKLGKNAFGLDGVQHVAALSKRGPVKCLDLRGNHVGDDGARILAMALRQNKFLECLHLSRNHLYNPGVIHLAGAILDNQHLQNLDLQRNLFNDDGAGHFVTALQKNHHFIKLKIRDNLVSERVKAQLLDLLVINSFGPDLARRTKDALQQQIELHQQQKFEQLQIGGTATPIISQECVICFDSPSNCILLPCQHSNCCLECGKKLRGNCHMCRQKIVKIFGCQCPRVSMTACSPPVNNAEGRAREAEI